MQRTRPQIRVDQDVTIESSLTHVLVSCTRNNVALASRSYASGTLVGPARDWHRLHHLLARFVP